MEKDFGVETHFNHNKKQERERDWEKLKKIKERGETWRESKYDGETVMSDAPISAIYES